MARGSGQFIKLHFKSDGFKCLCCAPPPSYKKNITPHEDGT